MYLCLPAAPGIAHHLLLNYPQGRVCVEMLGCEMQQLRCGCVSFCFPLHKQGLQAERTDVYLPVVPSQTTATKPLGAQLPGRFVSAEYGASLKESW